MAQNKMLIDAAHPEETRVVVVRGNRVEEFDFESENKTQIRGNIYLAKVTRVEPSLQAAFVDYGGNRHGFLAFSEIHPDYYQIPVADRQALLDEEAEDAAADKKATEDDGDEDTKPAPRPRRRRTRRKSTAAKQEEQSASEAEPAASTETDKLPDTVADQVSSGEEVSAAEKKSEPAEVAANTDEQSDSGVTAPDDEARVKDADTTKDDPTESDEDDTPGTMAAEIESDVVSEPAGSEEDDTNGDTVETNGDVNDDVESVGAEDALEEVPTRRKRRRQYKIQEVIKRRQIILVQIVKEERGNKGAALTTYLSLAGRYSVLMPNTARGGGISRKITNVSDRKHLKTVASSLDVPEGMGVILRTAGASRTKAEIRRDFEYLLRLWETVRSLTLQSTAPCLVYEEGSLIKRSIRDLYDKQTGEILVSGDDGYREAKGFMRMLMPSHAKNVKAYKDQVPIFTRNNVESQLDKMLQPQVTLKSGGYLVINQTEALVAIDVNSGRATRQHSIEETAAQTNLEAAEEVARQLRLRDLAGLIVVDFIDMEEKRNNRAVEKRLKEALKNDRARIQISRISHFGLLEMSRQRIRASVLESTTQVCPTCEGTGHIRSQSSVALHVLRTIEEYLLKGSRHNLFVKTSTETALYLLNSKRMSLVDLEQRFGLSVSFQADGSIGNQYLAIERGDLATPRAHADNHVQPDSIAFESEDEPDEVADATPVVEDAEVAAKPKRRRRRGRGKSDKTTNSGEAAAEVEAAGDEEAKQEIDADSSEQPSGSRRRRSRRSGRRGRNDAAQEAIPTADSGTQGETLETPAVEDEVATLEKKPKRRRRTSKARQAVADETEQAVEATSQDRTDTTSAEEAAAPRRTTRRPRKAKVEPEATKIDVASAEPEMPETEITPANDEPPSNNTAVQTAKADEITEEQVAKPLDKPRRNTRRKPEAETPQVATSFIPVAEEVAAPDEDDASSKKGGWWQRRSFF